MGSSELEFEGERAAEVGLAMRAQLVLSLHYLYLLQPAVSAFCTDWGASQGSTKIDICREIQEGLGKLQEICAWDQARPCHSPALLPLALTHTFSLSPQ